MRRLSFLVLVLICSALAGCYRPAEKSDQNALGSTFTVGVIVSGLPADYGWSGDPIAGTNYTVTSIENHRVLILPVTDQSLDNAVSGLVDSGARVIFLPPNLSGETAQYPNIVFIHNLSTRDDVARLLPGLASAAPDSARLSAAEKQTNTAPSSQKSPDSMLITALICTILAILIVAVPVIAVIGRHAKTARPSQTFMEVLIGKIRTLDGEKPKKKRGGKAGIQGRRLAIEDFAAQRTIDFAARGEPTPILHRLSTYVCEDQWFDDSFSIERDKKFLGECGIGIAKIRGSDQAGALEIWMFDKNDIRTQTATIMTKGMSLDAAHRARLQKKGPIVEAVPDANIELETKTLRLWARILEVQTTLDEVNFPTHAFDHIVIELAVWERS